MYRFSLVHKTRQYGSFSAASCERMEVFPTESLAAGAGVLNVWHLAHYTRFQNSIMESVRADFAHGDFMGAAAAIEHRCADFVAATLQLI